MNAHERRFFAALGTVAVAVHLWAAFSRSLWTPDEPRVAGIAREMLDTGGWARPRLAGEDFYEKPPLYFWCSAASIRLFGTRDWAPRLPSLVFGFGTLLFTALAAGRAAGTRAGAVSAAVLASSGLWIYTTQWALVDSAAGCAAAAAMWGLVEGRLARTGARKATWYAVFWAGCAAGLMAKSVPAVVAPGAAVLLLAVVDRDAGELLLMQPWMAYVFVALLGGPWMAAAGTHWLGEHVTRHILHRVASGSGTGHEAGPLFYLWALPAWLMPVTVLAPAAAVGLARAWPRMDGPRREAVKILALWIVGGLVAYSIPATKRGIYMLPLAPAAAALAGIYLDGAVSGARIGGLERAVAWAAVVIAGAMAAAPGLYALAWGNPVLGGLVVAAAAVMIGCAAAGARRADPGRAWGACAALVLTSAAGVAAVAVPELERTKSLEPFARLVGGALSEPGTDVPRLVAYAPDETLLGVASFYLGRRPRIVRSAEAVRSELARPRRTVVVTMSKGGGLGRARTLSAMPGVAWARVMMLSERRAAVAAANFVPKGAREENDGDR